MAEQFVWSRAKRESITSKITIEGPSGAGKTVAALQLAYGLVGDWNRIVVIDTENRRALYTVGQIFGETTIGEFQHLPLVPPYSPWRLTEALRAVESSEQFGAVILDSMSKEWEGVGGTLELVGNGNGQNQFAAWKGPGDAHRRFIDSIQFSNMHVIATMRSKVKYDLVDEENKAGRLVSVPKKRGMEAIQRSGTEYEFDVAFRLEMNHDAEISKDNTRVFMADTPGPITPEHGRRIVEWSRGASSQVGSPEWVTLRVQQLTGYGGTIEGLASLWKPIGLAKGLIKPSDYDILLVAKDSAKSRLQQQK